MHLQVAGMALMKTDLFDMVRQDYNTQQTLSIEDWVDHGLFGLPPLNFLRRSKVSKLCLHKTLDESTIMVHALWFGPSRLHRPTFQLGD